MEKEELEYSEDDLIEKCLYDSTYSPDRGKACLELAKKCHHELETHEHERDHVIKKIINEVSFKNYKSFEDTVEVDEEQYPRIYSEPNLFDGNFDEDEYIKTLKQDKTFGKCSLAIHGLEKQFMEQIEKGFFQTTENATHLQSVEGLILDRRSTVKTRHTAHPTAENTFKDAGIIYSYNKFKIHEICNIIDNPKINREKYMACSIADLNNTQDFVIKKAKKQKIGDYSFQDWDVVSTLDCWHNFLGLVEYPEVIKNKWLEIQLAHEAGEISEEKALELIKELSKMEEMFQAKITEGNTPKFNKPTSYQPTRLRLYGSQKYLNTLFNNILVEYPLDSGAINNSFVINTIKQALSIVEIKQLMENRIITDAEYEEFINIIKKMSLEEIKEKLRHRIRTAYIKTITANLLTIYPFKRGTNLYDLIHLINEDASDFELSAKCADNIDRGYVMRTGLAIKPIIIDKGIRSWSKELSLINVLSGNHDNLLEQTFLGYTALVIKERIRELNSGTALSLYWNWKGDENYITWTEYDFLKKMVNDNINAAITQIFYFFYDDKLSLLHERKRRIEFRVRQILYKIRLYNNILRENNIKEEFEGIDNIFDVVDKLLKIDLDDI